MLPYDPCDSRERWSTFGPKASTVALRDITRLVLNSAGYSLGDDGIYNPRKIAGSNQWSTHAGGRAWDCHVPVEFKPQGDFVAQMFVDKADLCGICEVIWYDHRWVLENGRVVKKDYLGPDHRTHVHVAQTEAWVDKKHSREEWLRWYAGALFGKSI